MGFLKNYGILKAITGETKDERLMGVVLASLDNDEDNNSLLIKAIIFFS